MRVFEGQRLQPVPRAARWETLGLPYLVERGGLSSERRAVVFGERSRTFGELRDRARRVGDGLIGIGIEPGDRVAFLSTNRLEYFEIELGISRARGVMVPLNWRLRAGELATLLRRSGATTILVEDRFLATVNELRRTGEVPDLRTVVSLGEKSGDLGYEELCGSSGHQVPTPQAHLDDPHEIIFTSGTTGDPTAP
jgi:acyl-CoA synthetase (AMP-forming)/AMP-acid ligase II